MFDYRNIRSITRVKYFSNLTQLHAFLDGALYWFLARLLYSSTYKYLIWVERFFFQFDNWIFKKARANVYFL